jgi:hypothetical protein
MSEHRVQAIRVACDEESQKHFKTIANQAYQLPTTHDIFTKGELSELSVLVGMPLLILKLRPSLLRQIRSDKFCWGYGVDGDFFPNTTAAQLMARCTGATATTPLLHPPPAWNQHVGSILIVRQDGKPLYAAHMHLMIAFLTAIVHQGGELNEQSLAVSLTPTCFGQYYDQLSQSLASSNTTSPLTEAPPLFGDLETVRADSRMA